MVLSVYNLAAGRKYSTVGQEPVRDSQNTAGRLPVHRCLAALHGASQHRSAVHMYVVTGTARHHLKAEVTIMCLKVRDIQGKDARPKFRKSREAGGQRGFTLHPVTYLKLIYRVIHKLTRVPLGSGESHILLGGGGGGVPDTMSQLSRHGVKFDPEVTDDVTGQVKVKMVDFSGLARSSSTISMLSANQANESAWIVSLTFVSRYHFLCFVTIIQVKVISGHQVKRSNKKIFKGEKIQTHFTRASIFQ